MRKKLKVVGGTYFENCITPTSYELSGSGLRGACSLSGKGFEIDYFSFLAKKELELGKTICSSFDINPEFIEIQETVTFSYEHPLNKPIAYGINEPIKMEEIIATNLLYYGLNEANLKTESKYVVYDPQNGIKFSDTASKTDHLALILNRNEAIKISGLSEEIDLKIIGRMVRLSENAEVVVIKNGPKGAIVFEGEEITEIPVFKTFSVWPIGSGDIFSAAFALKWMMEKQPAKAAALYASMSAAGYCENRQLPIPQKPKKRKPLKNSKKKRMIYLAGPFFDMGQKWLINECRDILHDYGNDVFSPWHDVGFGDPKFLTPANINAIKKADLIFAVLNGKDPGTLFEIGYARALKKRIIVFHENVTNADLFMLIGTGCKCYSDFSTAIYDASW